MSSSHMNILNLVSNKINKCIFIFVAIFIAVFFPPVYAVETTIPLIGQSNTLLPDGNTLYSGGGAGSDVNNLLKISRITDSNSTSLQILPFTLLTARTGHTSTVLPDGTIFIFGGSDASGQIIANPEIVDLIQGSVKKVEDSGLSPRKNHSATLLTDGRVLIAGGFDSAQSLISTSIIWNSRTQKTEALSPVLHIPRYDHQSGLLENGEGFIDGGKSTQPNVNLLPELFNPITNSFELPSTLLLQNKINNSVVSMAGHLPIENAVDVPVDTMIAVRFNKAVQLKSINTSTISIVGPAGAISGQVVGAGNGMLAFFTPSADLIPDTNYTVFLKGISDANNNELPLTVWQFSTHRFLTTTSLQNQNKPISVDLNKSSQPVPTHLPMAVSSNINSVTNTVINQNLNLKPESASETEDWIPGEYNRTGQWRILGKTGDPAFNILNIADLNASSGVTAVSGHIERFHGRPLSGVTVSIGTHSATTDNQGRFLISGLTSGIQQMQVDGTEVVSSGRHYTKHYIEVDVKDGVTTTLANPIYLPRVDPAQEITISSPADHEIVLTHPSIPGLEVHIPKGAVLREYDGKIVTKVSITPIPIDRAPYPTPTNFSVYFTLQPGGAFVDGNDPSKAIKIIYPNYQGYAAGTQVDFWNYDPNGGGWGVYGQGVVSKDGKKIIPDTGVGFRQIMTFGYAIGQSTTPPPVAPPPGGCEKGGDPVDCATGLFLHSATELIVKDISPINITHTYRQNDNVSRAFGIGANLSYSMYLYSSSSSNVNDVYLILADGGRVHFHQQSTSVWTCTDSPTSFYGSTLTQDTINHGYKITLVDKTVFSFANHSPNQLLGITDRNGNTTTITLSGGNNGNISQITSPSGRYVQFAYDAQNRITQATDNINRVATYTYDAGGRLATATNPAGGVEQYGYDASNRMTTVTDRNGNTMVTNVYDTNGRVQKQTLADGAIWQFAYQLDANGNVTQMDLTDPRGYIRRSIFNASGFVTQRIDALGQPEQQTTTFTRNTTNLVTQIVDPLNRTTNFIYDTYGMLASKTRLYGTANAVTETFTYDPIFHQLIIYYDPLNNSTILAYDSHGNLTGVTDSLSNKSTIGRNAQGLPISFTDALNHQTLISYQQNDMSSVQDALGNTTNYFTDNAGRVISVSDPLGYATQYSYDSLGRLLTTINPESGVTSMTYDKNGNTLTVRDPRNLASHVYTYDGRNRVKTYTDPLGKVATNNYDGMSNVISTIDRKNQTTTYTYDALNRLKTITYADASTVTIIWDAGNRPTQFVDSLNGSITYSYDNLDRLTQETSPQGQLKYQYDNAGRRTQLTILGQSTPVTYQYDNANRLTQIAQGSTIVSFGYDNANRRTSITLPNGIVKSLTYDNVNELLSITFDKGTTHIGDLAYTYDSAGRRISQSGTLAKLLIPSGISSASYDVANRLTSWNGTGLTYDTNGNLTNFGTKTYSWDARNQLVATSDGSSTYSYDVFGRRKARTVSGVTTNYLHDGKNPLTINGNILLSGAHLDEFYVRVVSGTITSLLSDSLGSTVALTDSSGTITASYSYSIYGDVSKTGTDDISFQYTGRENDGLSKLYYYRSRYYSTSSDRFISSDPIGLAGGVNTYAYVRGNPIKKIDPLGLEDLILEPTSDPAYKNDKAYNNPNYYTVGSHGAEGDSDHIYGPKGDFGMDVNDMASAIIAAGYNGDKPIQLVICYAGNGGDDSLAQKLADSLSSWMGGKQISVQASPVDVIVGRNFFGVPYSRPMTGAWKNFNSKPQSCGNSCNNGVQL